MIKIIPMIMARGARLSDLKKYRMLPASACTSISLMIWAVIAALWGLLFGPLMYSPYFCILGGWRGYFAMWIAGIPYDLTHAAGNFVFTLVLYPPLHRIMEHVLGKAKYQ